MAAEPVYRLCGCDQRDGLHFITFSQNIKPMLEIFHTRGLMFVDNRVTDRSVATRLAEELGFLWAASDTFIDRNPSRQ
jgi:polysaccharide deacetylase 2 family uncharacterized protein YibQ